MKEFTEAQQAYLRAISTAFGFTTQELTDAFARLAKATPKAVTRLKKLGVIMEEAKMKVKERCKR